MSFLIDTDICSAHLRSDSRVTQRFLQYCGHLHLSAISIAELRRWTLRSTTPRRFDVGLNALLLDMRLIAVDLQIAETAGKIDAELRDRGIILGISDAIIAASALIWNLTVVTHNVRHFREVPGIRIVDWIAP